MRVDEDFLEEVGLGEMPEDEKTAFMKHAREELEMRVGQSISSILTDAQLAEFDEIEDDEAAADWLQENAPNYRDIVLNVFKSFKREIIAEQAKILGY